MGYRVRTIIACVVAPLLGLVASAVLAIALPWIWNFVVGTAKGFIDFVSMIAAAFVGTAWGILVTEKYLGGFNRRAVFWTFAVLVSLSIFAGVAAALLRGHGDLYAAARFYMAAPSVTVLAQGVLTFWTAKVMLLNMTKA